MRSGESVTTDEPTVVPKPLLDVIVMKDSQGDRSLANPAGTDEGDWCEAFRETDNLLNQLVASTGAGGGDSPGMLDAGISGWICQ